MISTRRSTRESRRSVVAASAVVAVLLATTIVGATPPQRVVQPWEDDRIPESVRNGKPWQRAVWEWENLTFPSGELPEGARLRALREVYDYRAENPQLRSVASWTSVGPTPLENRTGDIFTAKTATSGRVSAVAVNPRKKKEIILGAAQGGIHMSSNGGKSWTSAGDDLATLAVGAIAYAPGNTSTIYVGTGEAVFSGSSYAGVGVYKSTNGGKSWTLINQTDLSAINVSSIVVDPDDENHVVMSTSGFGNRQQASRVSVGIYESTDGGVTWSLRLAGHATDLVADAKNFNNLYAGVGTIFGAAENGVYRSTNGGATWTKLSGPWTDSDVGRVELAISPSKPDTMYVGIQDDASFDLLGLFKTTNASGRDGARVPGFEEIEVTSFGDGWGEASYCAAQCWYDHVLVVDPKKPDTLWAGGIYLWKLTGSSWEMILPGHVDIHALAFSGNKQLFVGNDGGIFSTKNAGKSWTSHNDGLTLTQFYHGSISDLDFLLAGSQDNGTSLRDAGSARRATDAWTRVLGGDGADNAISSADPANQWMLSFQNLGLRRTLNGGGSYTSAVGSINTDEAPFIAVFGKCASDDDTFYAGTDRVWKATNVFSTAGAPNWSDQGPNLGAGDDIRAIAIAPSDSKCNTVAVATDDGDIFYTKNGGKKWNDADKRKQVPGRRITSMAFHPDDKNTLTLVLAGFDETTGDAGHVFRSTNINKGKPQWKEIGPGVNLPFRSVVYQPGDAPKLWVGSDLGVWEQTDNARGSVKWTHHGPDNGLPNVAVYDLEATEDGVAAFTFGRGAWVIQQSNARRAERPR